MKSLLLMAFFLCCGMACAQHTAIIQLQKQLEREELSNWKITMDSASLTLTYTAAVEAIYHYGEFNTSPPQQQDTTQDVLFYTYESEEITASYNIQFQYLQKDELLRQELGDIASRSSRSTLPMIKWKGRHYILRSFFSECKGPHFPRPYQPRCGAQLTAKAQFLLSHELEWIFNDLLNVKGDAYRMLTR